MKQLIKLVVVLLPAILVGCSGNKPSANELKNSLIQNLPGYVELKSFSIQASQNFGNDVEPNYGSRFRATVVTIDDLYKKDVIEKGATFVRLVTKKEKQLEIFGKIQSKKFQGAWKNNVTIDGNPLLSLGSPLNQFTINIVIIRGSDEEEKYLAKFDETSKKVEQDALKSLNNNPVDLNAFRVLLDLYQNLNDNYKLLGLWERILNLYPGDPNAEANIIKYRCLLAYQDKVKNF